MKVCLSCLLATLTLIGTGCLTNLEADAPVPSVALVTDGQAAVSLVLPAEPDEFETLAATELTEHVKQITGADLALGQKPVAGLTPLYIGRAAADTVQAQLTGDYAVRGAFHLVVTPARIDIAGNGEGPAYGAYELLEQLGVRWFMPGELGTVLPSTSTLALAEQQTRQAPSFQGRHFQMPHVDWQTRLRCGGPNFPAAHGLPGMTGAAGKKLFEEHPEYYALINGERKPRQACVSNPGLVKLVTENAKAILEKRPNIEILGMGPNDGAGFCECEDCRALDSGDYDPFSAETSVTDRYIWFFNQVLAGLEADHPEVKIGFYIYHNYMRPPQKVKPNPRITGTLAPIALCRIHGPRNPVCPEKHYYEWLASEWGDLIPELWDRGYWSNLACPGFTFPIVHRLRDQIPMGKEAGMYGWRVETFPHWGTQLPSMYIAGKLMWQHDADVDALMQDFYDKFFGPAAEPMGAYIDLMNTTLRDTDHHTGCSWDFPRIYTPALRKQAQALLRKGARQAPDDSIYARRVTMIQETFDYTEAFCEMMDARVVVDFPASQQALDRLDAAAEKLLTYDPPMVAARMYKAYMRRFYRHCTEQGYARVTGGNTLVAAAEDEWDFQLDPDQVGEDLGYFQPSLTGPNWQRLKTSSLSWSTQGLRYYKGMAWYRQRIQVAPEHVGKRLFIWCGGVDEVARVWVNGQAIGNSHGAAMYPFELDATGSVEAGWNTVVIAVNNVRVNELGTGGILAPVILYAPAAGADATLENTHDLRPTFP